MSSIGRRFSPWAEMIPSEGASPDSSRPAPSSTSEEQFKPQSDDRDQEGSDVEPNCRAEEDGHAAGDVQEADGDQGGFAVLPFHGRGLSVMPKKALLLNALIDPYRLFGVRSVPLGTGAGATTALVRGRGERHLGWWPRSRTFGDRPCGTHHHPFD